MNTNTTVAQRTVEQLMVDFETDLREAARLHPIAIPLTDVDVMAGEYAPEVIKRRIHRRAKLMQFAITRTRIRCNSAGLR